MGRNKFCGLLALIGTVLGTGAAWGGFTQTGTINKSTSFNTQLRDGYVYTVTEDTTITSSWSGTSALWLSDNATVVIYIPTNVTLTVKGGDGSSTSNGGAGIFVPPSSTLVICGEGKLKATGGRAADGSRGGDGYSHSWKSADLGETYGGSGGCGGGGAGAGIGGVGATARSSVASCGKSNLDWDDSDGIWGADGQSGGSGYSGYDGGASGTVRILGSLKVEVYGGGAGYGGACGSTSGNDYSEGATYGLWAGPSAGGGGGGGGGNAWGIGGGGGSGGGGGAGGGGAMVWRDRNTSGHYHSGEGGRGGAGGSLSGATGTSNGSARGSGKDYKDKTRYGGTGGSGGSGGSRGPSGKIYASTPANISGSTGVTVATATTYEAAEYAVVIDAGGEFPVELLPCTLGMPMSDNLPVYTRDTEMFKGYYSEPDGKGKRYYNEKGVCEVAAYDHVGGMTLYAFWQNEEAVYSNLVVNTTDDPETFNFGDGVVSLREAIAFATDSEDNVDAEGLRRITFDPMVFTPGSSNDVHLAKSIDAIMGFATKPLMITGPTNACVVVTPDIGKEIRCFELTKGPNLVKVKNLTFTGFRAKGGENSDKRGGVFYCERDNDVVVENCCFWGNKADTEGAVVHLAAANTCFTASRCSFIENTADDAIIYAAGVRNVITLNGCTFALNAVKLKDTLIYSYYNPDHNFCNQNTFFRNQRNGAPTVAYEGVIGRGNLYVETRASAGETDYPASMVFNDAEPKYQFVDGAYQAYFPIKKNSPADGTGVAVEGRTHDILGHEIHEGVISLGSWNQDWERASTVVTTVDDIVDSHDGLISFREAMQTSLELASATNALGQRAVTFAPSLWDSVEKELVILCSNEAYQVKHKANDPLVVTGPVSGMKSLVFQGVGDNHSLFYGNGGTNPAEACGLLLQNATLRGGYATLGAAVEMVDNVSHFCVSNCFFTANYTETGVVCGRGDVLNCTFKDNDGPVGEACDAYVWGHLIESTLLGDGPSRIYSGTAKCAVGCTAPAGLNVYSGHMYGCATNREELAELELKSYTVGTVTQYAYEVPHGHPLAGKGYFFWHNDDWSALAVSKMIDGRDKKKIYHDGASICYNIDVTGRTISLASGDNRNSIGSFATTSEPATLVVDSVDASNDDGMENYNDGPVTLRDAIARARDFPSLVGSNGPGYRITFADDLYAQNDGHIKVLAPAAYEVNGAHFKDANALTIVGDQNPDRIPELGQFQADHIFTITNNAELALSHLTLHGNGGEGGTGAGGCATVVQGKLKTERCTVEDFHQAYGGAIAVSSGSSASLHSTTFNRNSAEQAGGAVWSVGGELMFNNCVFNGNKATQGGAIAATNSTVRVIGATLSDNKATQGGAVYQKSSTRSNLTLVNCSVLDNEAEMQGGAVWGENLNATVVGTTFRGNTVADTNTVSGAFYLMGVQSFAHLCNTLMVGNTWKGKSTEANFDASGIPAPSFTFYSSKIGDGIPSVLTKGVDLQNRSFIGRAYCGGYPSYAQTYLNPDNKRSTNDVVEVDGVWHRYEQPKDVRNDAIGNPVVGWEVRHDAAWANIITLDPSSDRIITLAGTRSKATEPLTTDITARTFDPVEPQMGSFWRVKDKPSFIVTTLDDVTDEWDAKVSLREAIAFADVYHPDLMEDGKCVIRFSDDLTSGSIRATATSAIIKAVDGVEAIVIEGPTNRTITVDGEGVYRALTVLENANLEVRNLVFTNCLGVARGGVRETYDGGAILNDGFLAVSNCAFYACSAGPTNAAPAGYGGAVHTSPKAVTRLERCTFADNIALRGGAVSVGKMANDADEARLTAIACTFANNRVLAGGGFEDAAGGAAHVFGGKADAAFVNCTFTGNEVADHTGVNQGNAVSVDGVNHTGKPVARFVNSVLVGNGTNDVAACGVVQMADTVYGGRTGFGSATDTIWIDDAVMKVTVPGEVFAWLDESGLACGTNVTANGACHLFYPLADGVSFDAAYVRVTPDLAASDISYATDPSAEGLPLRGDEFIALDEGELVTLDQIGETYAQPLVGARAMTAAKDPPDRPTPEDPLEPGAIAEPTFKALRDAIAAATEAADGQPIRVYPAPAVEGATIVFDDTITLSTSTSTLEICGPLVLDGASAHRLFALGTGMSVTFRDVTFTHGAATGTGADGIGGAILVNDAASLTAIGCTFADNSAATYGGAIAVRGASGSAICESCTFTGNAAGKNGSAIYRTAAYLQLKRCTVDLDAVYTLPQASVTDYAGVTSLFGTTEQALAFARTLYDETYMEHVAGNAATNRITLLSSDAAPLDPGLLPPYCEMGELAAKVSALALVPEAKEVVLMPTNVQPNLYYGLAVTENIGEGFSESTVTKWVRADADGNLPEPLRAPAEGESGFYKVITRESAP